MSIQTTTSLVSKIIASWRTEPEKWELNTCCVRRRSPVLQFLLGERRMNQADKEVEKGVFLTVMMTPVPIITGPAFFRLNPLATLRLFIAGRRLRKWHINKSLST
jgi:hypothetical protein